MWLIKWSRFFYSILSTIIKVVRFYKGDKTRNFMYEKWGINEELGNERNGFFCS